MDWLGIQRVVVVQPNAYGDDNQLTMDAVAELGDAARGVVVVKPGVSDAELDRLTKAGARGLRVMALLGGRSEEHTSELQSLMRISYAVFCLKKQKQTEKQN